MKSALNENIKELRMQLYMSQVDLAKKLNISKQCVSNWENDNIQPSIEMLIKLSDLFCVSTDYLLGRASENSVGIDALTEEQSTHIRLLISDFTKANKK